MVAQDQFAGKNYVELQNSDSRISKIQTSTKICTSRIEASKKVVSSSLLENITSDEETETDSDVYDKEVITNFKPARISFFVYFPRFH